MGPPPRSFAAHAHDCIMARSLRTYRIQGCGAMIPRPMAKLPLRSSSRPQPACAAVLGLSRRGLETTARAAKGRATADLDIPVRVGLNACVGRGEETGFQVEQRNWNEGKVENGVKYILTSKATHRRTKREFSSGPHLSAKTMVKKVKE